MKKHWLIVVLFFPSLLVAAICVAGNGLAAVLLSPLLILLPITQFVVGLTNFTVIFPFAMVFAVICWGGMCWSLLRSATFRNENARTATVLTVGIVHAIFIPWALRSLLWYV